MKEEQNLEKTESLKQKGTDASRDAWILGPEYDFWLNDKDAIYDELYKDV